MKNMKKRGNGPGRGNKPISTAVPEAIYEKILDLASQSKMKPGKWAREVLCNAANKDEVFALVPVDFTAHSRSMVAEEPPGNIIDPAEANAGGVKKATTYKTKKAN
jgi:hypothetical protein